MNKPSPSHSHRPTLAVASLLAALAAAPAVAGNATSFTYQGRLNDTGSPATGRYDLQFTLLDSAAKAVGSPLTLPATPVAEGLFTAVLDFGPGVFDGNDRWISIGVRTNGSAAAFVPVLPPTAVTSTPYAQLASRALSYSGPIGDAQLPAGIPRLDANGQTFAGFNVFGSIGVGTSQPQFPLTIRASLPDTNDYLGFQDTTGATRWHLTGVNGGLNFVETGVADYRLFLAPGGGVGIGTPSPQVALDVAGRLRVDNAFGSFSVDGFPPLNQTVLMATLTAKDGLAPQLRFAGSGNGFIDIGQNAAGDFVVESADAPRLTVTKAGNVGIGTTAPATMLDVKGEITCTVVNITSDRNAKESFAPVSARAVLEKVARLPITTWRYKSEAGARHIGPMAQDFHEAFGLGHDDRHITSVDEDGVALAAIQGLNEKLGEKESEIGRLRAENEALAGRLATIERMLGVGRQTSATK